MKLVDYSRIAHINYIKTRATTLLDLSPKGAVLIVAPHPDDEVIGCGGLIARLVKEGNLPHIIVMTGGEGSHEHCCDIDRDNIVKARRGLTRKALEILGVPLDNIHELDYPDGAIDFSRRETNHLKSLIDELRPQSVFVPHWGEGWSDHTRTEQIIMQLMPYETEVYEYCVWMWYYNVWRGLDWKNAAVLRMTPEEHRKKREAMDAYTRPLAPCGKPWSGVLPPLFLKANSWNKELYFRVR